MRNSGLLLGLALVFGVVCSAHGDLVFDNGAGGAAGVGNGFGSDKAINFQVADDVTLASTTVVTQVDWTGVYANEQTLDFDDNFEINIYADDGSGLPGTQLASFAVGDNVNRTFSGISLFNIFQVFDYSAQINFNMLAGTKYHVGIWNDTTLDPDDIWLWAHVTSGGDATFQSGSGAWSQEDSIQDFRLHANTVPEPGSLAVLSVLGACVFRRRRG
ncbi:MAG: PEP-CTERM sorting domain-containing protein [Planctomycetota bacterium]